VATDFDRPSIFRLIAGILLAVLCLGIDAPMTSASEPVVAFDVIAVEATVVAAASVASRHTTRFRSITRWRPVLRALAVASVPTWRRRLQNELPQSAHHLLPPLRRGPPALLM
jgi:hypothetical protein